MEMFIVPQKSGDLHKENLIRKVCEFPGCSEVFMGTGKSKFCNEHRKRKYRKKIDEGKPELKKAKQDANNQNMIFNHGFTESVQLIMKCQLDGCEEEFSITIIPKVFSYPQYCELHRNPYKRKMFLQKRKD